MGVVWKAMDTGRFVMTKGRPESTRLLFVLVIALGGLEDRSGMPRRARGAGRRRAEPPEHRYALLQGLPGILAISSSCTRVAAI
jgi:hypothetical protein